MGDTFDVIVKLINTVGFPIAISIYVLYSLQTTMEKVMVQMETLISEQKHLCSLLQTIVDKFINKE